MTPEKLFSHTASQGMFLFQNDQCFYKDAKVCVILGYSRAQIESIPAQEWISTFVYPDDQAIARSILLKTTVRTKPFQLRIKTSSGKIKWVEIKVRVIQFNHVPTIQMMVADITQQKIAENNLIQSELTYRTIFDSTASGIILSEADMIIKYVNRRFCQIVGKTKKEVEGKRSWTEFMSTEDLPKMRRYHYWRRAKSHKAPRNYEFNLVDKNGQPRRCLATVTMIPGTKISVASFLDISERIRGEVAIKQSKKRFKSAFDNAPLGIFLIDKNGIVEQVNKTCLKILGLPKNQIFNQKVKKLAAQQLIPKEFKQLCQDRKERSLPEVFFKTKDGRELWLQIICSQISQVENSQTWMVMLQDVSDTVIARKMVEDLPNRILQAHEEEKQLLSQEIHDTFSQSLAALKMSIQASRDQDEVLHQVDSLINLSRSIAHNLRPEVIDKLGLVAAIHNFTKEISERTGILVQMKTNILSIPIPQTIAVQLFRVVQESVTNAIKHSLASMITVTLTKRDGHLTLVIRDNGKGFNTKQTSEQLLHKKSLGLKIMNERATKIGATCTIKSVVGQGTTITINCPLRHMVIKRQ